jgi:hypothetical protein
MKGLLGEALHAVLWGAGHNIRLLPKKLAFRIARVWRRLIVQLMGIYSASPSMTTCEPIYSAQTI